MRAVDLDFQPHHFSPAGIVLLVLGLLAMGLSILAYRATARETNTWRDELARLQQPTRNRTLARAGDDKDVQQLAQAASLVARDIHRPWDNLFSALEEAKTDNVALLSLTPDASRGVVQIAGEAKHREAILDFVQRLSQGGTLRNVFLVEDQLQQQDPEKPYRFLVSADWASSS